MSGAPEDVGPPLSDTDRRELEPDGKPIRPALKILLLAALVLAVVVWVYALWGPRHPPPGTMDDTAFGQAAEPVCARTVAAIDELPLAHETTDPLERADVLDQANQLIAEQLDALAPLVSLTPDGSEDRRRVSEWLADWHTYLGDREAYPDELRADRQARFHETPKDNDQISDALLYFALKNGMPSCAPPGDLA